jgi:hypothetical protein
MGLINDAGLESFHKIIGCNLKQSHKILNRTLEKATTVSSVAFMLRNGSIKSMKLLNENLVNKWNERFERIATIESEISTFLLPESEDMKAIQSDTFGQLSFNDDMFKCLNIFPFVLLTIAMYKIWVVPFFAISTPIVAWILPYIFLKFMYKLPITQNQYSEIIKMVWSGNPLDIKNTLKNGFAPKQSMFTTRFIIQSVFMTASFIQSLVQPIQNAIHLYKTDLNIIKNGSKIIELRSLYDTLKKDCKENNIKILLRNSLSNIPEDPRIAIRLLMDEPERFKLCMSDLAEMEILWRISQSKILKPAYILETGGPLLQASNLYDISLGNSGVPSSVFFSKTANHAVLTGPNGGGKSSFLRAILQAILIGQSYGVAPADNLMMRRFGWISSGLRLQDAPGNLSMFETEVWFAANLLKKKDLRGSPGLVLYDELFHSTNPPDGVRTAEKFLTRLWKSTDVLSIVSTHVFSLVKKAPASVKRLCCKADFNNKGVIQYKFNVEEGVCTISSVNSIWRRFKL